MSGEQVGSVGGAEGDAVALTAARALLRVDTRSEAAAVLRDAIEALGGSVVDARAAGPSALPGDVSLGVGEARAVVPLEPSESVAEQLRHHLPALLDDARAAAARCDRYQRQATRARTDALTGLAGRGEVDLRIGRATAEDVVCLLDLDGFKRLNDTRGHAAGDRALRRFGRLLRSSVRDADFVGRYGGDEFLLIFSATPLAIAEQRMTDLVRTWSQDGPGVGVSIGVAPVDERGSMAATAAADRALYRAKGDGGGVVRVAGDEEYPSPSEL
jgi:diguanylate cyclase (GGDEF)-like protein